MLPSELPPPSPKHRSSSADMESLLLRRSYLQDQANSHGQPGSRWLSLAPVEQSAVPPPPPPIPQPAPVPAPTAASVMPAHQISAERSHDRTPNGLPASPLVTEDMPTASLRDCPPELVRSYPNSALSTDSEELDEYIDPESAAMYGQGDSIDDHEEEDAQALQRSRKMSISTTPSREMTGLAQLRQSIGLMSQEAKEQEADDMRAHHIYKLHLARLEEAHWGSS